ncbi:hypothetical protein QEH59_03990 [Coraliomargarita sp. SDUM461004]|uniref:SLA1 homology domain-containing protein n=1 Tax=Thalassobacterium sedimentorum TaxID=3041258 RepID=A0ABU1AI60_9BACT|nr:hypothetical protein [Coraliomargarita sp. SDUM461004]MDQ8193570.1 hypothetical protein [Coraliomargarita sp. SDUM461004]
MRHLWPLFLLAFCFSSESTAKAEFRTFTDSTGREMEAKLNQVSGEDVYIERRDGLATKVDITRFSKEDQIYIRDWARTAMLQDGAIEVRFTTEVDNKTRWASNGGGIMRKTWKQSYGIVLTNDAYIDIKDIRIEYLIFKFEDALAAEKRSEGEIRYLFGQTKVPTLKAGQEASVETEKFPMLETKLESGYYWKNGGKETSEDEMRGIWIKVYVGDILATEVSKPENLMRKEQWPTSRS